MKKTAKNASPPPQAAESSQHAAEPKVVEQDALEHIRTAAYYKWLDAGSPECDGCDFWLEAEQEFLESRSKPEPSGEGDIVQEASEESFPASDPPAHGGSRIKEGTPLVGI